MILTKDINRMLELIITDCLATEYDIYLTALKGILNFSKMVEKGRGICCGYTT
jgi:hypothetical protein